MTAPHEIEAALEAILFVASEPLDSRKLIEVFDEGDREAAEAALARVLERYRGGDGRGVAVDEVAGGVRLVTRPELHGYLRRFFEITGRSKLSMAALETLAIIAYRQPITGPEIQELRGVQSAGVLKTLLDRRLIRISGRRQVVGKPFLYRTTREFLMHFGLQTLDELPPLEEFEETFGGDAQLEMEMEDELTGMEDELTEMEGEPGADDGAAVTGDGAAVGEDPAARGADEAAVTEAAGDAPAGGGADEPEREGG